LLDEPRSSFCPFPVYWQLLRSWGSYLFYLPCSTSGYLPTARLLKIKEEIEFVVEIYVFEWKCCLPLLPSISWTSSAHIFPKPFSPPLISRLASESLYWFSHPFSP